MRLLRVLATLLAVSGLVVLPVVGLPAQAKPVPPEVETHTLVVPDDYAQPGADEQPPGRASGEHSSSGIEASVTEDLPGDEPGAEGAPVLLTGQVGVDDFGLVGLTWDRGSDVRDFAAQVRVRQDGDWSEWLPVEPMDDGPDPGSQDDLASRRGGSSPLWVGAADGVQVRLEPGQSKVPSDLRVVLVDPGTSPADRLTTQTLGGASAGAATAAPRIITRREWGADENLRLQQCPSGPSYSDTIQAGFVHHTATTNSYSSATDAMREMRAMYAFHVNGRGWCDLGYNFVVDKWGNIYEGRFGGTERPVVGAHTGGFNSRSFGVSMMGTYSVVAPSAATLRGVQQVLAWKLSRHGRDPQATAVMTSAGGGTSRYPAGRAVTVRTVSAHRDVGLTECPGNVGFQSMDSLRRGAASLVEGSSFVRALYQDYLGRAADDGGLAYWASVFRDSGGSREVVANAHPRTYEGYGRVVDDLYNRYLGRGPDPSGRDYWVREMLARRAAPAGVAVNLLSSEEVFQGAGRGRMDDWVGVVYQRIFGRSVDPSGLRYYSDAAVARGRGSVVWELHESLESRRARVDRVYRQMLQRGVDQQGADYWAQFLTRYDDVHLATALAVSDEYFARARSRYP